MSIDMETLLAPIAGDNPAGENLRYEAVYDEIKEARRADDPLDRGEWQHEVKTADWARVEKIATDALQNRSKDIQIAVWLMEALIKRLGFEGVAAGLDLLSGLMSRFWDQLYPEIDDGDLDFRAAPIDFLNEKLWYAVKEIPVTDPGTSSGFSWFKWSESRDVGSEDSLRNQWGDMDDARIKARDQKIAEGKITVEEFDGAVARSSLRFYATLLAAVETCREKLEALDQLLDEKFGDEAPRLAEFRSALDDCHDLVAKLHREKAAKEPAPEATASEETPEAPGDGARAPQPTAFPQPPPAPLVTAAPGPTAGTAASISQLQPIADKPAEALWSEAIHILRTSGIQTALAQLMSASCGASSVREKTRHRLIMAKLCLQANRLDLARPIAEELYALLEELQLDKWESPVWIGDVLDTLYQCLTKEEDASDNRQRAQEILERLCRTDITRAMSYHQDENEE
jgi:type VI secretion system protein ImpA